MKPICEICQRETNLSFENTIYKEYICSVEQIPHFYCCCLVNGNILRLQVRLSEDNESSLFFRTLYDQKRSEFWTRKGDIVSNRVKVDEIFIPDFSDLDKLKEKIKLYLLLS